MKPTPPGWPRLATALYCDDAREAIAWYAQAFGFELQIVVDGPGGSVAHSELRYGEAIIMVADSSAERDARFGVVGRSPRAAGGANTQSLMLYVDDVDAHCARALAAGARVTYEPADSDHGPEYWCDRTYACVDRTGTCGGSPSACATRRTRLDSGGGEFCWLEGHHSALSGLLHEELGVACWQEQGHAAQVLAAMRTECGWRSALMRKRLGALGVRTQANGFHVWLPLPERGGSESSASAMANALRQMGIAAVAASAPSPPTANCPIASACAWAAGQTGTTAGGRCRRWWRRWGTRGELRRVRRRYQARGREDPRRLWPHGRHEGRCRGLETCCLPSAWCGRLAAFHRGSPRRPLSA